MAKQKGRVVKNSITMKRHPFFKGFSLIELMVTVAVIGILAGIAIPSYQKYIRKAKAADVVSILGGFKAAISNAYIKTGKFPTNLNPQLPYRTNVWYDSLGPNIQSIYWANDPTSPSGRPKATIEALLSNELGAERIYFVAAVDPSGAIQFYCGFWQGSNGQTKPYMPSSCNEENLINK